MGIILDIPFDESTDSLIASDYGPEGSHATVRGATFHSGREAYAIHFDGDSYAHVRHGTLDLTGNFTVLFWYKSKVIPPYAAPTTISFLFAFSDSSIERLDLPITLDTWEHFAIVRDGTEARIYKDTTQIGTIPFTAGHPVEWAVWQTRATGGTFPYDLPMTFGTGTDSPYSTGDMDHLLIFDTALTIDEIIDILKPKKLMFFWEVDGRSFLDWNVYVEDSKGLFDALKIKESNTVDWKDQHGLIVDLKNPKYQPREIELSCWMKAGNELDFTMRMNEFLQEFTVPKKYLDTTPGFMGKYSKPGYHRLTCRIDKYKPLVWEVYLAEGTAMDKKWRDEDMTGRFKLKLIDNNPVRRVIRYTRTSASNAMMHIRIKSKGVFNIFWGDGHVKWDAVPGDGETYYHRFDRNGTYEIIVAGEVDDIEFFMTNGIVIWNRL